MNNKIEQKLDSREVAEMMEMQHKHLLEKIDGINKDFVAENVATKKYWEESTFENRGKQYRNFLITKRGCEFLAHKTTGTKGNLFTDRYMDRFAEMEDYIEEIQNGEFKIKNTNVNAVSDRLAFTITLLTNLPNDEYKNITVSKVLDFISPNNIESKRLNNIKFLLNEFLQLPDVIIKKTENGLAVDGLKFFNFFNNHGYSKHLILNELENSNLIYHSSHCRTVQIRVGNGNRMRVIILKGVI